MNRTQKTKAMEPVKSFWRANSREVLGASSTEILPVVCSQSRAKKWDGWQLLLDMTQTKSVRAFGKDGSTIGSSHMKSTPTNTGEKSTGVKVMSKWYTFLYVL
jgi:hypothetical protein